MLSSPLPAESVSFVPLLEEGHSIERVVESLKRMTGSGIGRERTTAGNPSSAPRSVPHGTSKKARFEELRKFYRQVVMFPDRYHSWIAPAVKAGLDLAKSWKPDLIYSSCPPHSGHIVAQRIAKNIDVPWVAELRDLWANNPYNDTHPIIQPIQKLVANSVMKYATACVALTVAAGAEVEASLNRRTIISYNGFGAEDFAGLEEVPPDEPDKLTLIHAGIIYAGRRDPTTLFQALAILGRKRQNVRVKFYHDSLESVSRIANQLGVQDCVEICEPIPRQDILRLGRAADVLLLCRWANPADDGIIPGKLFEYIGARRPILSVGSVTGEAADIIRANNFGFVCNSPHEIATQLTAWLEEKRLGGGRIPDLPEAPTGAFIREEQFKKVTALVSDVIEETASGHGSIA